jgi:hypothetical protein
LGDLELSGPISTYLDLGQSLSGLSARKYRSTLINAAQAFGVSPSAVSDRLIEITTEKLKEFKERKLNNFMPLAVFVDTVHSTNPIESLFSQVRACEKNIKRYQDSQMAQRWLASVLLYAEQSFRKIKGFEHIPALLANIEANHATSQPIK